MLAVVVGLSIAEVHEGHVEETAHSSSSTDRWK